MKVRSTGGDDVIAAVAAMSARKTNQPKTSSAWVNVLLGTNADSLQENKVATPDSSSTFDEEALSLRWN